MKSADSKRKKSFFQKLSMPHPLTLLFLILICVGLVSWILKGTEFVTPQIQADGTTLNKTNKILQAGIIEWFMSIFGGFKDGVWLVMYIFVLGIWTQMILKSKALDALIGKIGKNFSKEFREIPKELKYKSPVSYYWKMFIEGLRQTWMFIPLLCFLTFAGSTSGSAEETIAYYPILIPLVVAAGFDVWTGFLLVFIGTGAGVMGSTVNPFSILAAVESIGDPEKIKVGDGMTIRAIAWVAFSLVTFSYILWYGAKVKFNKNKSYVKDLFEIHQEKFSKPVKAPILTKKRTAIVVLFILSFIILALSVLPFYGEIKHPEISGAPALFNSKINSEIVGILDKDNKISSTFIWGKWGFPEITFLFLIIAALIGIFDWKGEKDFIDNCLQGMKDILIVAVAIGMARSVYSLLKATNLSDYMINQISDYLGNIKGNKNTIIPLFCYILFVPLTFLIPSSSALASAAFPILGPAIYKAEPSALSGSITAFGWAAGFANLFVPTYGVVVGALAITHIPYSVFFKNLWKYFLGMFMFGMVFVVIGGQVTANLGNNNFF